ncbi:uncharacterized protein LOC110862488 isoform X2 [Folsomia candida]|uniref:uncharacterized protein LOC110862488 isoform X2 n=1 Tax=Folsomia candida TaxID=158441 RepID=UPI00160523CD|nr:uncharacterized protein LOC110862488 isoform X2 [Folsomia candida]
MASPKSNQILETIINENYEALRNALDVSESLLNHLEVNKIITEEAMDSLVKTYGGKNKADRLLRILRDLRTDDDIPVIMDALGDDVSRNKKAYQIFEGWGSNKRCETNHDPGTETINLIPVAKCTSDMKQIIQKPRKIANLVIPCPGRTCHPTIEYEWECWKCKQGIEYGYDNFFYCRCGKGYINMFEFKCPHPNHGVGFKGYDVKCMAQPPTFQGDEYSHPRRDWCWKVDLD